MFQLEFFELVRRLMDWCVGGPCEFLNIQQFRALHKKPGGFCKMGQGRMSRDATPDQLELYKYLRESYPPYFGVTPMQENTQSNHMMNEHY